MIHKFIFLPLISFLLSYFLTGIFKKIAIKFNILDFPDKRKVHKIATPLLGGLSIYFSILFIFLLNFSDFKFLSLIMLASSIILILGLIDDIKGLSANLRLLVQVFCAFIVISVERISFLPKNFFLDFLEVIITLIWIVGITNAYNYLDGLDGLAAGSFIINSFFLFLILLFSKQSNLALFFLIFLFASFGFLPYNFKKAKIFLGDSGSTFLGFLLASSILFGNWAEDNLVKISIPVLILGVPIFDMIFTTITRIMNKKIHNISEWLSYASKDHFHHSLVDLGLSKSEAVIFIYLINIFLGISAIMVSNDKAHEAILSFCSVFIIFLLLSILILVGRRHKSGWKIE